MAGLVPAIHVLLFFVAVDNSTMPVRRGATKAWMAGTSQDKPGHDGRRG